MPIATHLSKPFAILRFLGGSNGSNQVHQPYSDHIEEIHRNVCSLDEQVMNPLCSSLETPEPHK